MPYFPWTLSTKKQTPAKKLYHMSLLKIGQQLLFFWGGEPWITVPEGVSSKKPHEVKKKKPWTNKQMKKKHQGPRTILRRLTVNWLRSSDQQTSPIQLPCFESLEAGRQAGVPLMGFGGPTSLAILFSTKELTSVVSLSSKEPMDISESSIMLSEFVPHHCAE